MWRDLIQSEYNLLIINENSQYEFKKKKSESKNDLLVYPYLIQKDFHIKGAADLAAIIWV